MLSFTHKINTDGLSCAAPGNVRKSPAVPFYAKPEGFNWHVSTEYHYISSRCDLGGPENSRMLQTVSHTSLFLLLILSSIKESEGGKNRSGSSRSSGHSVFTLIAAVLARVFPGACFERLHSHTGYSVISFLQTWSP